MNGVLYLCEISPDGNYWIKKKICELGDAWKFLISREIETFRISGGRIRIVNLKTKRKIGDFPKEMEFGRLPQQVDYD